MKVNNTVFDEIKESIISLQKKLSDTYSDVTILVEKTNGKNYRFSKSGTIIKDNMFANTGAVIRLKHHLGMYEFSFNDFSDEYVSGIPMLIKENLRDIPDINNMYKNEHPDCITSKTSDTTECFNKSTDFDVDPESLSDENITESLENIYNKAIAFDSRIIDCVCVFQYLFTHKMFISDRKNIEQHLLWSNGVVQPMASENDKTHHYLQTFSCLGGAELLKEMDCDVSLSCQKVIELLSSIPVTPGLYDVICMPDVTGLIAHEAFGHGVEMDMFVKDRALAKKYLGKPIASPIVTMHDNALSINESATYFFDDEGTPSHDTIIIKDGILLSGINDLLSAETLEVAPTGNGRRESYARKAYTRMTNTYFEPGVSELEDMIASIEYGILLENGSSGMEDPKNWGIQCMVNMGREIKNGKFTGRIFSPVCLSGYVPDLLSSITMISNELHLSGCGYCGKGYKEWVKVSDGGAAIKAKVQLS